MATLVLVAGAVALRAWHQTSAYEVFLDEIQYSDVGNSFAAGVGPQLFGEPFYLHPPLFFTLLGAVIPEPVDHMTVGFVLSLRPVMLAFGALNTLLVVAVARRVVGQGAALLAGAVYALDPFVIRFDSRVMLEAPMMLGVLAGMFALLSAATTPHRRARRLLLAATGVAWGLALITKTTSGLVTGLPLVVMFVLGWGLRRRETLGVVALQVGVYLVYLGWVVVDGHAGAWFDQTLAGTFRALGLIKETGFSSANAPSFTSRIVANLGVFGSSYLLIAVSCTAGGLLLLRHRRDLRAEQQWSLARPGDAFRLVLCWFAGVLAGIVYTGGLGEVEEQTFYLLAVPCAVVLAVLVRLASTVRLAPRILLAAGLALALCASGAAWWQVHSRPDDAYRRVIGHLYRHVPQSQQIALGEQTAQFVTPGYGVHKFTSIDDARAAGARYGLVSTQLTALGLAPAPQSLLDELARRYAVEVAATGRTSGELVLYDLNRPLDGSPPVVPGAGK